ncbi:hypothetical protein DCAR_0101415 [Daucus carota subsp. sativus]|uniref:Ubiquitin-like protease family profile domain-containing protein n=1 Tax=Daucus carota subsp. sativus TaxID=79200 RepID=A0AAF0W2X5_DAUCS|nr:hypothetical protein DCAR_0101415 [Daucus carota subsp. sativus]
MEREKNVMDSTHALTYWTTERLQKIDIAHFYSGKITKMGEVIKFVDPHTTKSETGMMQRQQIAMEVIKKVCADIDHDYGCGVDVENEVIFQYLREAVDKLENLQLQHFKLFTAANLRYHSDNIIDVLKNRFINLNEEAIDFVLGVLSSSEHSGRKSTEISNYKKDVATKHNTTNWNKEYLWEWLNSNEADDAVVFKWNQISCTKEDIRSLNFGKDVSVGAIDAWCCLLNLKEKSMPNAFKHRLFCFLDTTANITHPGKVVDDVGLLHEFGDKVEQTLQTFNFAMSNINMVFFPICSCKHYYTVCYDISEPSTVVLDNSSSGGLGTSLYGRTLELLHNNFVEFLKMKNHPSVLKLQWVEPVTLNLPWNTKFNTADSGVFLMRHMETYFGGDGLFLAEKFLEESHLQQHQLNKLRFEYARLMICTSINEQRGNVMDIMESWHSANTANNI